MNAVDLIVIGILLLVIGSAVFYVGRAKKKGQACIGCPHSGKCSSCSCKNP